MISLSRATRVPGERVSPDASLSGSVCMFPAVGSGHEGAGLGRVEGGRAVPGVSESWLSFIAASVVGVASPGSSCGRNTDPADFACTAAPVGIEMCAASGSLVGTCTAMVGGV